MQNGQSFFMCRHIALLIVELNMKHEQPGYFYIEDEKERVFPTFHFRLFLKTKREKTKNLCLPVSPQSGENYIILFVLFALLTSLSIYFSMRFHSHHSKQHSACNRQHHRHLMLNEKLRNSFSYHQIASALQGRIRLWTM